MKSGSSRRFQKRPDAVITNIIDTKKMNLSNLNISKRLALGFGVMCVLLVFVIGVSITMLGRLNAGTDELANQRMPASDASNKVLAELNDIAIALRNMMLNKDPADRQRQLDEITASSTASKELLGKLQGQIQSEKGKELLVQMLDAHGKYVTGQDGLLKLIQAGKDEEANAYLIAVQRPALRALKTAVTEQIAFQRELSIAAANTAANTYAQTRILMLSLGAAALAIAALVGWWITVSITRPLARALEVANTVAAGDLTSRIEVTTGDETGQLLQALKTMNENLVSTVSTVRSGTETIASASAQMAAGNQDLSARTEQQAGSLEETASSMEELTSTVKQNADNARQANMLAEAASNVAARGGNVIEQVVGTMGAINSSAGKIADIIGVIDGIAFQTNILALNAAVEAARAGEQGRGFAVVASEVRNLAQRSAAAAKEIKQLIGDSTEKVAAGSKLVGDAGATMQEIVESVKRVTDIMAEITSASQEQTSGIEQINMAIVQMDQVTQQNASLVEEAAAASESMQEQAAKLAKAVAVFSIDRAPVAPAARAAAAATTPKPLRPAARAVTPVHQPAKKQLSAAKAAPVEAEWEEF
jgi:methyl-accepting chemotaxis protein